MNALLAGNLKSKTSWTAIALIVFGTLAGATDLLSQIIPPKYLGIILAIIGLIVLVLRNVTTQSIVDKGNNIVPPPNTPPTPDNTTKMVAFLAPFFMSVMLLTSVASVVSIPGCAMLSAPVPTTFNQKMEVATLTLAGAYNTVKTLVQGGVLGSADGQNIVNQLDNITDGLKVARSVYATNNASGGDKLTQVSTALQGIMDYLAQKQSKVN